MRTFVTGMVFMAVLAAAVFRIIAFAGLDLPDIAMAPPAQQPAGSHSFAPFEPSPPAVVDEMVRIAGLTKNDLVYDLGSGDGRVVIAAARAAGARCVGVEMDHDLVAESRRIAETEKLSHLVRFVEQDITETDLSEATVVMLFLSPQANAALLPRLLGDLQPGSRIVSHCHDMGEWQPDRTTLVENHRVHAWIVPADASGSWTLALPTRLGESPRLDILQQYQKLTAWIHVGQKTIAVSDLQLRGTALSFTVDADIGSFAGPARFSGEVKGGVMQGTFRSPDKAGAWKANRMR